MERVCFCLQVKPDRIAEYTERHRSIWPEMAEALRATGWNNYSLFLRPDGLLIGYFETDSFEAALAGMAATDVNARWQAEMAEFFEGLDGAPDEDFTRIAEVFHLEDQLTDPGTAPSGTAPSVSADQTASSQTQTPQQIQTHREVTS